MEKPNIPLDNLLKPIPVQELLRQDGKAPHYRFFIPSYQRGYRWGEIEVRALLDDILEFSQRKKNRKERYCLQPIVVKQLPSGQYEVLDGQQRLTTLFILLSKLKQRMDDISLFSISYETRPGSALFLQNLNGQVDESNPDYYYISKAYHIIECWFSEHAEIKNLAFKLYEEILENLDFIWYQIHDPLVNPIDVFTRINVGKIPLTNAELVKAVFLSKDNLTLTSDEQQADLAFRAALSQRQSLIAMEWDQMEKQLQDESFWKFIYNGLDADYETRIDYILDLVTKRKPTEKNRHHAFQVFYAKIRQSRLDDNNVRELRANNSSFVEREWDLLKQYFDILMEWYNHKTFNHLIGFLIYENGDLLALLNAYKDNNRKEFLNGIIDKIARKVDVSLSTLRYGQDRDNATIRSILVFHNLMHSLLQPDTSRHFAFQKIKNEKKWSLEHIYAQNSEDILEKDQFIWAKEHFEHFQAYYPDQTQTIGKLSMVVNSQKTDREEFLNLFKEIDEFIQQQQHLIDPQDEEAQEPWKWMEDEDAISNLTLLDVAANSALSNSVFAIKRDKIKRLDSASAYVPSETRKVFLKYYSKQLGNDAYWTRKDKIAYVQDIQKTINALQDLKNSN